MHTFYEKSKILFLTYNFVILTPIVYLGLSPEKFGILTLLILLDSVTGILKRHKLGHEIASRTGWRGVFAKLLVLIALFTFALVLKGLDIDEGQYLTMIMSLLIATEGYSTLANIYIYRTGDNIKEYDVIQILVRKLADIIDHFLESFTK